MEQVHTSTKRLCTILDAKYKKEDLNEVLKNQSQYSTEKQHNKLLKLFKIIEEMFDITLENQKTYTV